MSNFDVWPTPIGAEDLKSLTGELDRNARDARKRLEGEGCRAAHWRLSGEGVESICAIDIGYNHRVLVAFPTASEVSILLAGPRVRGNADLDVYLRLYQSLGIAEPIAEHRKPPCCDEGDPPVDPELVERFIDNSKALIKPSKARQSRATRSRRRKRQSKR